MNPPTKRQNFKSDTDIITVSDFLCLEVVRLVIYVDVLLVINIFVNYFLLLVTKALLRKQIRRRRLLLGALLGGAYSLIIFLPNLPNVVSLLLNLVASVGMVLAAIPIVGIKDFLKSFAAFFAVNFAFAGLMLALWLGLHPNGMVYNNGAVYFSIDIQILLFSTVGCYVLLMGISRLLRRRAPENALYDIQISTEEKCIHTKALLDTGHTLSDGFSDTPVLVADRSVTEKLANEQLRAYLQGGHAPQPAANCHLRLIPYSTVGGSGVLKAFPVACVRVPARNYELHHVLLAQSAVPFSDKEYSVLLCNDFFERGGKAHVVSKTTRFAAKP